MSADRLGSVAGNDAAPGLTSPTSAQSISRRPSAHNSLIPTKQERFMAALLDGPKTTRELEREPVFDHCGHSTASELRKRDIGIHTEMVEIIGYAGLTARVARYSLTEDGRQRALSLLGRK